ncbi:MAG: hypothetical protein N2112_02815, partial [Gemmataceae bacterium]|nr:hypothetical protein [Gemmataceae bacterium]
WKGIRGIFPPAKDSQGQKAMTRLILDNVTISVVVYSELANPKRHFPSGTFDLQTRDTELELSP